MPGEELGTDTNWSDVVIPPGHWLHNLKPLAPIASGLATIGSNPKEWVYNLIATWLVGGILDAATFVLGWVVFAFERTASILLGAAEPLTDPIELLADAIVGAIETLYSAVYGVAASAGLVGPPAAAFAVAVVLTVLAVVAYAVAKVIPGSDLVEGGLGALR